MAKGSGCCCGKCQAHLHCRGGAGTCCKCVPSRICVSIYPPSSGTYCDLHAPDDDPYGPALVKTFLWDCALNSYSGSFRVNGIDIPFTFAFLREDDGTCWFTLESDCLGYSSEFGYDNRLKVPVAGSFDNQYEGAERINSCANPEFDFIANLTPCAASCGDVLIRVAAADYQPAPDEPRRGWTHDPYSCYCGCVCITLTTPDGVFQQKTCIDPNNDSWNVSWTSIGSVTVYLASAPGDRTILRMESSIGSGDEVYATCTCREGMFAEWNLGSYGSVKITCDPNRGCIDCKCWCRCVCMTYFDDHVMRIVRACWDEYRQSWSATFVDAEYGEISAEIRLVCDPGTGITYLSLATNLSGAEDVPAGCPEISASWSLRKADYSPATISISCDTCGRCLQLGSMEPCGCYDFIPDTLYATFSPNALPPQPPAARDKSCTGATGVITLRFDSDLQCWLGSGTPFSGCATRIWLKLACVDNTPGAGRVGLSVGPTLSSVLTGGEVGLPSALAACAPFEASWQSLHYGSTDLCCGTTSGPFDIIDSNAYDITITE